MAYTQYILGAAFRSSRVGSMSHSCYLYTLYLCIWIFTILRGRHILSLLLSSFTLYTWRSISTVTSSHSYKLARWERAKSFWTLNPHNTWLPCLLCLPSMKSLQLAVFYGFSVGGGYWNFNSRPVLSRQVLHHLSYDIIPLCFSLFFR
jgi:hypothetical protein